MVYFFSLGWNEQKDLKIVLFLLKSFPNLRWFITDVSPKKIQKLCLEVFTRIKKIHEGFDCRLEGSSNSRVTRALEMNVGDEGPQASNFKVIVIEIAHSNFLYLIQLNVLLLN